ncbi:MAG: NADP-dependent oxidoreductase [Mangrovibacterium sp.]
MKAIILNQAGSADNLIYQNIEKPSPKSGEVLIKTKALGINPMDVFIRSSEQMLTAFLGDKRPAILGWDVAGEISGIGENVTNFKIGDPVFTSVSGGGYAEFAISSEATTMPIPENISFREAAAVPVAALTAWQGLVKKGKLKKGDKVLIHAGSGGVGHFAIQIAKNLGAYVITTSSAKNKDFVMSVGADQHIDYQAQMFYNVLSEIDVVFDTIGGETRERSFDVLKKGGILVSVVPPLTPELQKLADEKGVNSKHSPNPVYFPCQ